MKTQKSFPEIKADVAKIRIKINTKAIESIKTKLRKAKHIDIMAEEVAKKIRIRANNLRREAREECKRLGHLDQYEYTDTEEGFDSEVGNYPVSSRQRRFCRTCEQELF